MTMPRRPGDLSARAWARFLRGHAGWLDRFPAEAPVYRLPRKLVDELVRANWIDSESARAEAGLRKACDACRSVGFQHGSPVDYPFLLRKAAEPARGRSIRARDRQAEAGGPLGDADLRRKGYVGRLLTNAAFLAEFAVQRELWETLPAAERPRFPIRGDGPASAPPGLAGFAAAFAGFCGRWALDGAASWDLPLPAAAQVADHPPAASPAPRGVYVFLPFHLPPDEGLFRRIRRAQEAHARDLGLADATADAAHYEAFARILDVLHLERVASARYRPPGRGRGFVAVVVRGIAASLGLREAQVDKWRKAASARLRLGEAASIPSFRGPS